jgi:hypothetical protein
MEGAGTPVSEAFKLGERVFGGAPERPEAMTNRQITIYWSTA